ncbi:hypothetical protein NQZ68_031102 [Dissostichus eleginoides]|nr:hypothetical protein NQZ68_031102 [Dissostichus eleginoides]
MADQGELFTGCDAAASAEYGLLFERPVQMRLQGGQGCDMPAPLHRSPRSRASVRCAIIKLFYTFSRHLDAKHKFGILCKYMLT